LTNLRSSYDKRRSKRVIVLWHTGGRMIHKYKVLDVDDNKLIGYEWIDEDGNWCHSYINDDAIYGGVIIWAGIKFRRVKSSGVTDKNGVEIYEGDVCQIMLRYEYGYLRDNVANIVGVVKYSKIHIRDEAIYTFDTFNVNGRSIEYLLNHELEVIGNIYENPELLGEPND
jgi:hypothetical protein